MDKDLKATPVTRLICSKCRHEMDIEGREPFTTVACEKCGTMLTVPVMLGSFLLLERMGAGGMGAVYRGLDTSLNRFVGIKVMKSALGEDAKLVESFLREAQAAAALNHRNIVQIYSCGQEKGQPYIVMELVTGGKLSNLFTKEKPIDEELLLKLSLGVAEGLSAANEVGLVHGDIKPENILIDQAGTPKIVDFGLAQFVNAQKDRGEIWGTPYYISPERARGNKADHRSDIYSLGATMFHALAGIPPFDGPTPVDVVLARLKLPPPALTELRPGLQRQTVELIERMMAADPFLRYPTSASLKSDMQAALDAAITARKSHPHAKKSNLPSIIIGVIAAALVAVVGALLVSKVREQTVKPPVTTAIKPAAGTEETAKPAPEITYRRESFTARDGSTRNRMVVEIFPPDDEAKLIEAAQAAARFDHATAYRLYYELRGKLDGKRSPRIAWLNLLSSVVRRIEQNEGEFVKMQDYARRAEIETREEKDPALMPKALAQVLSGDITPDQWRALAAEWPDWYFPFSHFVTGLQLINRRDIEKSAPHFEQFLAMPPSTPAWISAYRPLAEYWRGVTHDVDDMQKMLRRRIDAGDAAAARDAYKSFVAALPSEAAGALAGFDKEITGLERRQKKVADETAARAHRTSVQKDFDRVDGAITELYPVALRSRDFRRASLSASTLASEMKTAEGRQAAKLVKERIDTLESLKEFVIRAAEGQRYTREAGCELNGDVIAATPLGVRVTRDGRSVETVNWHEIAPATLSRLFEFYANNSRQEAAEQARVFTALALFNLMHYWFDNASNFARRAVELDAAQAALIRRLMPGLLP